MKWLISGVSTAAFLAWFLFPLPVARYSVDELEYGFKTSRVIATRYKNDLIGYNIGFDFPKDPYNADRAEISDFMKEHGGWIYQGGGYSGAKVYVKFKDVNDQQSANTKLREILPPLSKLIAGLE